MADRVPGLVGKKERMGDRPYAKLSFNPRLRRAALTVALLAFLLFMATACIRRKPETLYLLGDKKAFQPGEAATLVCSDQCRGSSQCGKLDTDVVILASTAGPAMESHDLIFPDKAAVTISDRATRTLQSIGEPVKSQPLDFYKVEVPEKGSGWVAGWCIGQPIVP